MKYSYTWLQSHIEDPLPTPEILKEKIIFHAFEVESLDKLGTGDTEDWIFDIKVLPDRAGDCLSHYGMAQEIAGLLDLNFIPSIYTTPTTTAEVSIDIQAKECIRYSAVRVEGVHVGPSPEWLVKKLAAVGQRSINNVVDATNFILLDMGQPTHAFDADKVHGTIVIRHAIPNENITTLGREDPSNSSGQERTLKEDMMVIADNDPSNSSGQGKLLAIAGVKGGMAAEVKETTTNIILEIASFDAASVRKTSRSLNLITDASKRFENNLSPHFVESARAKLLGMIAILAGGTVVAHGEQYPNPQLERAISFTMADMQRSLGTTIDDIKIVEVLDRYGYTYQKDGDFYTVDVPFWRQDITGVHDMVEEIGRVIGYDTIPVAALPFTPTIIPNEAYERIRKIKYYLSQQGYSEVMTYTFRKKGEVSIAYGPKDKSALRNNLSDALKESYEINRLNAPLLGVAEVKLFEVGTIFTNDIEIMHVATADKTGVHEWTVQEFADAHATELTNPMYPTLPKTLAPFKPWSVFPFITRDIAVWVSDENDPSNPSGQAKKLQEIVDAFAGENCVRPATLFDTFIKKDPSNPSGQVATSVAYRFIFQKNDRTLTDEEVEITFKQLISAIKSHPNMEIR